MWILSRVLWHRPLWKESSLLTGTSCSLSEPLDSLGLENQLINELALSSPWTLVAVWDFSKQLHINLLEMSVVLRLVTRLIKDGISARIVVLVDSNVVKCAVSKGRSSSKALSKVLVKLGALAVAGGIYMALGFCPTRLNGADGPTRSVPLRCSTPGLGLEGWCSQDWYRLASLPGLRRWTSNWARLILLLLGPRVLYFQDRAVYPSSSFDWPASRVPLDFGLAWAPCKLFDSTLGFPGGEGPFSPCFVCGLCARWIFICLCSKLPPVSRCVLLLLLDFDATLGFPGEGPSIPGHPHHGQSLLRFLVLSVCLTLSHGVLAPRNSGDLARQALRQQRPPLQEGRPVLGVTSRLRTGFLEQFESWLNRLGYDLEELLANHFFRIDELNHLLVRYGRNLYAVGRPYNHYAETINAIASRRPVVRRQLQEAWNFGFAWVREEPSAHHVAMPWQVLLACLTTCLAWGWVDLAGMLALSWGALLRVGEFTGATRGDLLLPVDTGFTNSFALLSLKEPKTRFTAARHQSAKLDIEDLLIITQMAFGHLKPWQRLWQFSGSTLRSRFKHVLHELSLDIVKSGNGKYLELGSLRPGGATWMLQQTEDGEFTRRRGRWVNQRIMELYIQEVSSFQFLSAIPAIHKPKVFGLCNAFPLALTFAVKNWEANIPLNAWYLLWKAQVNG
eukprot:Skav205222  [mRNA]  locus=scaffold400:261819:263843:- [translate_table: standard]